jgi:hypothetical protein
MEHMKNVTFTFIKESYPFLRFRKRDGGHKKPRFWHICFEHGSYP